MSPSPTAMRPPLTDDELAAIEARLDVGGLFVAHAHTDMTRLLAEVRRLRTTTRTDDTAAPDSADRRI